MKKTRRIAAFIAAMAMAATMAVPFTMVASAEWTAADQTAYEAMQALVEAADGNVENVLDWGDYSLEQYNAIVAKKAANSAKITIKGVGDTEHTFAVYQIMTGTYAEDDGSFSELKWANGIAKYNSEDTTAGEDVPSGVLDALAAEGFNARTLVTGDTPLMTLGTVLTTVSGTESVDITNLAPGYYVIEDTTNLGGDANDANSAWIINIAGLEPQEIAIKNAKPTVDKTVEDNDDGSYGTGSDNNDGFGESADHQIGETFQFKLVATIPGDADLKAYDSYNLIFHDTMSTGVTFDHIDSVKIGDATIGAIASNTASVYTVDGVNEGDAGATWTLSIDDVKKTAGENFGTKPITVEVLYTAHLNSNAQVNDSTQTGETTNNNKVQLEYSNNPDSTGTGGSTTKTEEDYVWVFTYKINNTKYKVNTKDGNELANAVFQLQNSTGTVIGVTWDDDKKAYIPNGTTEGNMTSQDDGSFNIIGLDAGSYKLHEVFAPEGYNVLAEDKVVEITAVHSENSNTTSADLGTLTITDGGDIKLVDTKNSTLPSTGGMGTVLFYTVGGVLVVGAGVVLISKKRSKDVQ